MSTYTAQSAAAALGVSDARIRQICIASRKSGRTIGTKHGPVWMLSQAELRIIRKKLRTPD